VKKLFFISIACFSLAAFGQSKVKNSDKLLSRVVTYLSKPNKVTTLAVSCLAFDNAEGEGNLGVYESHNEKCGGDPNTQPRVATFKLVDNRLFVYDDVSGDLVPAP
jgi:hypothetical protein